MQSPGNGKNSTLENPEFTLNSSDNITVTLTVTAVSGCQDSVSQIISITGLNKPIENRDIVIYPNPATSTIVVKYLKPFDGLWDIYISDINGKIVKSFSIPVKSYNRILNISISDLTPGFYFIIISGSGNGTFSSKFIKK